MRTLILVAGGLLLLGIALLAGRWLGGAGNAPLVNAARIFIAIWLAVALINMWIGVARAGYSVAEEFPIFLLIFAVPAAAAAFIWRKHA